MPIYKVGKRLGKGGFGQVFLAARMKQRKVTPVNKPNQVHHPSPVCPIKPCARRFDQAASSAAYTHVLHFVTCAGCHQV